jgi:hypothetical protein
LASCSRSSSRRRSSFPASEAGRKDDRNQRPTRGTRVQDLVRFVEAERRLTFEHPVPVNFLTPEEFREELTREAADISPKDRRELRASEAIMRALGLLHGDIDLLEELNTFSTEGRARPAPARSPAWSSPPPRRNGRRTRAPSPR